MLQLKIWKNAAIYTRLSENPTENGTNIEEQVKICKERCEKENYCVTNVYSDRCSGKTEIYNRKGLCSLLQDAKEKKISIIVFYAFDRLARKITIHLDIIRELVKLGIKIVCCREDIDITTDSGEFQSNIFASISSFEDRQKGTDAWKPYGHIIANSNIKHSCNSLRIIFDTVVPGCHPYIERTCL